MPKQYSARLITRTSAYLDLNGEPVELTDAEKLISSIYNTHIYVELYQSHAVVSAKTARQLETEIWKKAEELKLWDFEVFRIRFITSLKNI